MLKALSKVGNPIMKLILRTPMLHMCLSGTVMLLTMTGRRTGRRITIPVNYVRELNTVTLVTHKGRNWWRNLEDGAAVIVLLRGEKLGGRATPFVLGEESTRHALEDFYSRVLPITLSESRLSLLARSRIVLNISLSQR